MSIDHNVKTTSSGASYDINVINDVITSSNSSSGIAVSIGGSVSGYSYGIKVVEDISADSSGGIGV